MMTFEYYEELKKKYGKARVSTLIKKFNEQVGREGWTTIQGVEDSMLIEALVNKGVDVSAVCKELGCDISFDHHIKLSDDGKKIVFAD